RIVELHADVGAEEPHEHVAVHKAAEIPEHRLDLDPGVVRNERTEELLVRLTRLGYLHRHTSGLYARATLGVWTSAWRLSIIGARPPTNGAGSSRATTFCRGPTAFCSGR